MKTLLVSMIVLVLTLVCMLSISADELTWNLLTDAEAGYRIEDRHNLYESGTEDDGTPYMYNTGNKNGALYIYDDNNILGTYRTFSLEGDFYFDAFPEGIRDGQYTPEERPLSFLCWVYKYADTDVNSAFNAIRIDSDGYIYTANEPSGKTDVQLETGKWYNLRCVFTPRNGVSELYIDGVRMFDFVIAKFDPEKSASCAVRYFDGYYDGSVKMKNLIVKTDSDYTIEISREDAAEYIGYQVTKPEGDSFDARVALGVNRLSYYGVGYETFIVQHGYSELYAEEISAKTNVVYETLKDSTGKEYNVKNDFKYMYASALEIEGLPTEPNGGYFELFVRPYIVTDGGIRRYGVATVLAFDGEFDAAGYPVLVKKSSSSYSSVATDDTYIYHSAPQSNFFDKPELQVRNTGDEDTFLYRAAYYKFTLDKDMVEALDTAAKASLNVYIKGTEVHAERKRYDMIAYGVGTNWTEKTLTYENSKQKAAKGEMLTQSEFADKSYFRVDVLEYLRSQPKNADGSLTVAFCFANEGHENALLNYLYSKESGYQPTITISEMLYDGAELNLQKVSNDGYEPWGFAEYLVDEWFDKLRDEIYPKDENGNVIYHEIEPLDYEGYNTAPMAGDFIKPIIHNKGGYQWTNSSSNGYIALDNTWIREKGTRTVATLGTSTGNAFLDSEYAETITEYDEYGGIANAGFKGEATGFFHTEKHEGRYYIIDPIGNPFFSVGMNTVTYGDDANHKKYSLAKYGSQENYYKEITASLRSLGINTNYGGDYTELLQIENGLANVVTISGVMNYMSSIGRPQVSEGVYPHNNTINVFDPDMIPSIYAANEKKITSGGYADMPNLFAYTADNELPSGADLLYRYLTLDVYSELTNSFSYAAAWAFLSRWLDEPAPSLDDYAAIEDKAAINGEFLAFVYGRAYRVIRESIKAVDPNHMYIGSRVNGSCRTDENYLRAAGYYLDIISTNLYGSMGLAKDTITNFYRYSGKPMIVTEFYAKAIDAIDAHGYPLASSTGAGMLVQTQQERADYYEHYALALIESKASVGWVWYRYRDNDQGVYKTDKYDALIMLNTTYGENPKANTFMDVTTGKILTAAQVGEYTEIYKGEPLASNHNVNKGIYNSDFSSNVVVYTYDKNGKLIDYKGYEVQDPASAYPKDGDVLTSLDGSKTFTIGTVTAADGTVTKTVLTAYEGLYVALADSYKLLGDHLMGLVRYFDAN
jgi:hypothetical protein